MTAVDVLNVTALDDARAATSGGGGARGGTASGGGDALAGEASLTMRACDGGGGSSGGGESASDTSGWSVGTWECNLPPSAPRNDRYALELLVSSRVAPDARRSVQAQDMPQLRVPLLVKW